MENNQPTTKKIDAPNDVVSKEVVSKEVAQNNGASFEGKLKKRTVLVFVGILITFLFVNFFTYTKIEKLVESSELKSQTIEVLEQLEFVIASLSDAETGERGYLLTGDIKYLEPYNSGISTVSIKMDEVRVLIADEPAQLEKLDRLSILVNAKKITLQEAVELRAQGKVDEAIAIVLSDRGKDIMDNIREIVKDLQDEEFRLLEIREDQFHDDEDLIISTLLLGSIVGFFFVLFGSLIISATKNPNEFTE